jgi:SAM-dependent methyltransferase
MRGFSARSVRCAASLTVAFLIGCSGEDETLDEGNVRVLSHQISARESLAQAEEQFLRAEGQRVEFEVSADGAFTAALHGQVSLGDGNALLLEASGVFGGDSVSVWLDASEELMSWGNRENRSERMRPPGLRDAVVVGFVRMGVLHNLARLVTGAPPDRMDGDVRSWVEAEDPEWVSRDPEVGEAGLSFGIQVEGSRREWWLEAALKGPGAHSHERRSSSGFERTGGTRMTEANLDSQIQAAEAYESLFVPALTGEWAPRVADAVEIERGKRILDVGCGTGILAREIASRVGADGVVVGVDPSPGMLAVAQRITPTVEWREGMAESLPFPDESFDAAVSQFSLMFSRDRDGAVREVLRVLTPGGRLAVAVWNGLVHNPGYDTLVALVERTAGQPAADGIRAPFLLGDPESLAELFDDAGVGAREINTHSGVARFRSIRTMVEADLRGWLPVVGVVLPEDLIEEVLAKAEKALTPYVTSDGSVAFPTSAHIVTGQRE